MPCKNKLDASKLSLQILRGFGLPRKEPILPMDKNHNVDSLVVSFHPFPGPSVANAISLMLEKLTPPKPLYTVQAVCQAWDKSHVRKHVRLVRAASSHYATKIKYTQKDAIT